MKRDIILCYSLLLTNLSLSDVKEKIVKAADLIHPGFFLFLESYFCTAPVAAPHIPSLPLKLVCLSGHRHQSEDERVGGK